MFELEAMTKTKVLDVRVLAKKDRKPDEPTGAQLLLQATMTADVLACFDGFLSSVLYKKAEAPKQGAIDGLEPVTLTVIGSHVKRLAWQYEQTGCELEIDRGVGGKRSNILLTDCKVHRVLLSPRDGGSVVVQWTVDVPSVADAVWSKLPGLKTTEVELTVTGPDPAADPQQRIPADAQAN